MRDPWLMAVDKPAGLLSQPGLGPEQSDSVITRLQRQDQSLRLVHRLDRDTSGVLLLARSADALRWLSALFAERRINKLYQADVEGELHGCGYIASPLARLSRQPPRYGGHPEGRLAQTIWRVRTVGARSSRLWLRPSRGAPISCGPIWLNWAIPSWAIPSTGIRAGPAACICMPRP